MRGRPGDLLDLHIDAGVPLAERRKELLDDFALAPEAPETYRSAPGPSPRAGSGGKEDPENCRSGGAPQGSPLGDAPPSHPPVKPARLRPRTIAGFFRIVRHTSPLR